MTPTQTPFAGLEQLGPGDSFSSDGYAFQAENPVITDFLLKIGAILHQHDAHAAMANPTTAATLAMAATGGVIRSGLTISVKYTLTDGQGGESLPRAVQTINSAAGYADPASAPTPTISTSAGSLLANTYLYAVSVTDGLGGETALGPAVSVTVPAAAHAEVTLSGLTAITNTSSGSSTSAGWRMWRSVNGGNNWDLMSTGAYSVDTWLDNGSTAGNCTVNPLTIGTTGNTGLLSVTVPSSGQPAGATFFSIYACTDGGFVSPCLLGVYPVADFDAAQTFTALTVSAGSPPAVTRCYGGANQIDPATDIAPGPVVIDGHGITSGALSTVSLTSGVGAQIDTTSDRYVAVAVDFTLVTDTVAVAISPDGTTYSTLGTLTSGVAASSDLYTFVLPAGWRVKVTTTGSASISSTTYY